MSVKIIYYANTKKGVDVLVNVDGHDKGNYYYSSLETVKKDYSDFELVNVDEAEKKEKTTV